MDFEDSPEEADYRARCRAFLDANAERRKPGEVLGYRRGQDAPGAMDEAKSFQRRKHAAGFAGITWPKEWGGQGGSPIQQVIYSQEEAKYKVLTSMFGLGLGMCIPTICRWGTQEQRDRYAPPALRGDEVWCQFFSEPAGGSDLGALRTRVERDGDEWVVNGQKIWTSMAHKSDFGVLIARNDFDKPKHEGLTFFFLSTKTPGIEIRPIKQMSGSSHFNEVFFNDVRIPDGQRLGPVGGGWKVAISLLMSERYATAENPGPDFEELFAVARELELESGPAIDDAGVQEKLAEFYVQAQGLRFTKFRTMTALSKGEVPGPEASIGKLVSAAKLQEIAAYGLELMGAAGVMSGADMPLAGLFEEALIYAPAMRIAGGTDEILRNTIAERVLKLPADMRADKGMAFKDVPTGGGRA